MPRTIRLHLDEHCAKAIAEGLRRRGIDVTTTSDAGLLGKPDVDHLAFARRERRVIFTRDEDFLVLAAQGIDHAGIIYCRQGVGTIGGIIDSLVLVCEVVDETEMLNHVEYI